MRRALTLLETLLALAILSAVTGALVSWLTIASGTSAVAGGTASWEIAARRALNRLAEDIHTFDQPRLRNDDRSDEPRIKVEPSGKRLMIQTRNGIDGTEHGASYEFDGRTSGRLLRDSVSILDETSAFECDLDEEARILRVTITCAIDGRVMTKRYRTP
jgi:type II secretory pathway component PulJ